jgi:hypothetical protein
MKKGLNFYFLILRSAIPAIVRYAELAAANMSNDFVRYAELAAANMSNDLKNH